ncbi:probable protein phosphatase 2C 4 [Humulus lupulus]|uniref:probable protein phosphatase 2C 4 n=1 Tax=Humulus lupulus TaxID=3486 RepID=UPI002B4126C3|nr:probable protein phosphatase 2C 4 [Humulus lupulus]
MGNGAGKIGRCFADVGEISLRHDIAVVISNPLDEGHGRSFCYIRPDPSPLSASKIQNDGNNSVNNPKTTTFRAISGAYVSANTFTPLSTSLIDMYPDTSGNFDKAASFESSTLFASIPLQPVPRLSFHGAPVSGPIERGFMSGPIERGFASGPIDRGLYSGPIEKKSRDDEDEDGSDDDDGDKLEKSFSRGEFKVSDKPEKQSFVKFLKRAISSSISRGRGNNKSIVAPIKGVISVKESDSEKTVENNVAVSSTNLISHVSSNGDEDNTNNDDSLKSQNNLQWAQGKAGEDRVHIVISEEHGWVFVGIYDGFNGPDAPDFLLSNLYPAVHKELKGLLWNEKFESSANSDSNSSNSEETEQPQMKTQVFDKENTDSETNLDIKKQGKSQRRWKGEWNRERLELDKKLKENFNRPGSKKTENVLRALSEALRNTEDAYLDIADKMVMENPELALMGSCVLVMLMKGEDVYLMNVGDSRAVLAQKVMENNPINEFELSNLTSLQLTMDHSTYMKEEVERIKNEHPDDASAVMNERVKGYLKVTRAFGAGFLKQPKWNDALLEMFRINYVGSCPYITCLPSVYHHRLSSRDRFLILSSDGLYQYFTNEEAVSEVELFIASFPEGDPAQHLVQEVLFRAARKAGMDFHELLDIPQGERRRYHDDVSIIVISLEGRIWRSSV